MGKSRTERSMVRAMCGVQLKNRKRSTYNDVTVGFDHVSRRAIDYEVQRKKGRLKRAWKKQVEVESVNVGL